MKKFLLPIFLIIICLLTGCGAKEEKTMTCTRTLNQSGIKMDLTYIVKYKDEYVTNLKSIEKVTSDDDSILETYKKEAESIYKPYNGIKYYDYSVEIDDDTLISTLNINYSKVDTDEMIKADSSNKQIIKDGKVKLSDVESIYKQIGLSCEK
ncbi:MAG: YehR family protein [Bacilli bacterium]|nr:YehR family protein [Bacilli bacterium]